MLSWALLSLEFSHPPAGQLQVASGVLSVLRNLIEQGRITGAMPWSG